MRRKSPKHPMNAYTKRYLWLLAGCVLAAVAAWGQG